MRWFCDEAEFEASWEAWKAWAKMEEAPWRALNSAARLEHADFTKSLLDTGWCMGHRCRESLAPCFSRAGAAPHRAPPFLASAAPSFARLLALRMPMADTHGETDQNCGPRAA